MFRRKTHRTGFRITRKFAKKRLIWVTRTTTFTETAGTSSQVFFLTSSDWEDNTTAGNTAQYCKVLKVLWAASVTAIATAENRQFLIRHDDVSDAPADPRTPGTYALTDCVHWGFISSGSTAAATGANQTPDGNNIEFVHQARVQRRFKQDEALSLVLSPAAAAGNQLTMTVFSRTLVQLG